MLASSKKRRPKRPQNKMDIEREKGQKRKTTPKIQEGKKTKET
jgi:hypothetical protein